MATHFSILAWRIPWTEEPGGLQFIGSQRVGHDWSDLACTHCRDPERSLDGHLSGRRQRRSNYTVRARSRACPERKQAAGIKRLIWGESHCFCSDWIKNESNNFSLLAPMFSDSFSISVSSVQGGTFRNSCFPQLSLDGLCPWASIQPRDKWSQRYRRQGIHVAWGSTQSQKLALFPCLQIKRKKKKRKKKNSPHSKSLLIKKKRERVLYSFTPIQFHQFGLQNLQKSFTNLNSSSNERRPHSPSCVPPNLINLVGSKINIAFITVFLLIGIHTT